MAAKSGLIAAAFSAQLGVDIKCKDDAHQHVNQRPGQVDMKKVNISTLFSHSNDVVMADPGCHCVKVFGQDREKHDIDPSQCKTVGDVKRLLGSKCGVHPSSQKLICQGKVLQDHLTLAQQGVQPGVAMLMMKAPASATEPDQTFYVDDDDLDPPYDYDFTWRTDDGRHFERGGYPYTRPYGWDRAALKVLNRYGDNTWLGLRGIRTDSSSGEWAVSYHGTASKNIRPISDSGYDSDKSQRQLFGPGIYSTPSPVVAAGYATAFGFNGKSYKMILQNRVNLNTSTTVPKERTGAGAAYFVTPEDDDVRPYGVCLKAV